MAQAFSFSFAGDDIDNDDENDADLKHTSITSAPPHFHTSQPLQLSQNTQKLYHGTRQAPETGSLIQKTSTAFPIQGQTLLSATSHSLESLLQTLPSKIAYSTLDVKLDPTGGADGKTSGKVVRFRRRELWDVRMQIMAEDTMSSANGEGKVGLGEDDIKTGVYEGGFKSWECSVDLVRVLAGEWGVQERRNGKGVRVLEMGCGTALPSLALFQWHLEDSQLTYTSASAAKANLGKLSSEKRDPDDQENHNFQVKKPPKLSLTLADYNPSVLSLVTLPNLLLSWAAWCSSQDTGFSAENEHRRCNNSQVNEPEAEGAESESQIDLGDAKADEGELHITPDLLQQFQQDIEAANISLQFVSGAWGQKFVDIVLPESSSLLSETLMIDSSEKMNRQEEAGDQAVELPLLILAAETIYSPFALYSFTEALVSILSLCKARNSRVNRESANPDDTASTSKMEIKQRGFESKARALVGAKKVYFGVGGSLEDFVIEVQQRHGISRSVREEEEGVRRGVVEVTLP